MDYYLMPWKKYVTFSGRASRAEYWTFTLVNTAIYFFVLALYMGTSNGGLVNLGAIFNLLILLPSLAVTARRLHDTGHRGWWILIGLVPLVGWIVLLVFTLMDSAPGENKYGSSPKGAPAVTATPVQ